MTCHRTSSLSGPYSTHLGEILPFPTKRASQDGLLDRNHQRRSLEWKGVQRGYQAMPFEDRYIQGIIEGIVGNSRDRVYG